jgi:hypothetical protein
VAFFLVSHDTDCPRCQKQALTASINDRIIDAGLAELVAKTFFHTNICGPRTQAAMEAVDELRQIRKNIYLDSIPKQLDALIERASNERNLLQEAYTLDLECTAARKLFNEAYPAAEAAFNAVRAERANPGIEKQPEKPDAPPCEALIEELLDSDLVVNIYGEVQRRVRRWGTKVTHTTTSPDEMRPGGYYEMPGIITKHYPYDEELTAEQATKVATELELLKKARECYKEQLERYRQRMSVCEEYNEETTRLAYAAKERVLDASPGNAKIQQALDKIKALP